MTVVNARGNGHVNIMREIDNTKTNGIPAPTSARVALKRKLNVMHAIVLRDIRSRYFNHGLGFLIGPLFPVAHLLMLLTIYKATGRQAIFGDDLWLFFATGLVPALTFTYISRFMSVSVVNNKSMLSFPAVHLVDIMLARAALEFVGIVISILLVMTMLVTYGSQIVPNSPLNAFLAMLSASLLAIGVGTIASVISAIWPFFPMLYGFSMVGVYLTSGAPIYIQIFPEQVVYYCSFNPVFHAVEWMRQAYYLGYPAQTLDKMYLIMFGVISLNVGLLMERLMKRTILNG